ncbi:MAG TPA: tetratricopeptide repeat protein [Gammaproteobacteria bacterium]|nr:tetratricopeptide repeat protein [Gammaproteobacteria bacterium]
MNLSFLSLLVTLVMMLSACTGLSPRQPAPAAGVDSDVPVSAAPAAATGAAAQSTAAEDDLLYDILLGEVAGQREQLDVSVEHYQRAAAGSDDPRIAERALRIAVFAKQEAAALTAARRWVELEPESNEARQSLAALALRAGDVDEAYTQFDFLLREAQDETQTYQSLTGLLARNEDREVALTLMGRLAQSHAQSAQAHLAYARLALHAENAELALRETDAALAIEPDLTDALVLRAGVRYKLGDAQRAQQDLQAAVNAYPKNIELHLALARLLLDKQDLAGATAQFKQVIKREPGHPDALYSLGLLAMEQQQYKQAETYFRMLVETGKRDHEAWYYLARVQEQRGDLKQALLGYERVGDGDYWLDAQARMASLTAKLGDMESARQQLQSLRLRDPNLALRLYLVEGEILSEAGQLREALALYNQVLAETPNNHDVLYARALIAERLNDLKLAEDDLRRIISEDPKNYHALNALGYTLADRTDRLQEALALIEKAVALAPDEPAIVDSLGWVYYRLGNLDAAAEHLKRAYELSRGDAEIAAHYGAVLWEQGKRKEARALWDKARRADPENRALLKTMQKYLL